MSPERLKDRGSCFAPNGIQSEAAGSRANQLFDKWYKFIALANNDFPGTQFAELCGLVFPPHNMNDFKSQVF